MITGRDIRRIVRKARRYGYRGRGRNYLALLASASEFVRSDRYSKTIASIVLEQGDEACIEQIVMSEALRVADIVAATR